MALCSSCIDSKCWFRKIDEPTCDRRVALYGYLRGSNLKPTNKIHIAGCGDFSIAHISQLLDPCPLPERLIEIMKSDDPDGKKKVQRKSLNTKDKLLYAPMCMSMSLCSIAHDLLVAATDTKSELVTQATWATSSMTKTPRTLRFPTTRFTSQRLRVVCDDACSCTFLPPHY